MLQFKFDFKFMEKVKNCTCFVYCVLRLNICYYTFIKQKISAAVSIICCAMGINCQAQPKAQIFEKFRMNLCTLLLGTPPPPTRSRALRLGLEALPFMAAAHGSLPVCCTIFCKKQAELDVKQKKMRPSNNINDPSRFEYIAVSHQSLGVDG